MPSRPSSDSVLSGAPTGLHKVIVILLPLSLVLLVFGGILGLVSSLARSRTLLVGTAAYLLLCSKCPPLARMKP